MKRLLYHSILKYTGDNMVESTTIKVKNNTKKALDSFREQSGESYDDVIRKLVIIARTARKQPSLSKEAVVAIEKARARIKAGKFVTLAEAKKRWGV